MKRRTSDLEQLSEFETTSSLDAIALDLPYVPDKASTGHGYTAVYETYFAAMRFRPIKLLEIGVAQGNSLALWSEYFPRATIVGADIDLSRVRVPLPPRCRLWEMNQSNEISLLNMANNLGPWDLIIDDGSHLAPHQLLSFKTLWPYLNPGGLYAIEDLHVNYESGYSREMVDYIGRELQDAIHARGQTTFASMESNAPEQVAALTPFEREVRGMYVSRYLVLVEKR